MGSVTIYYKNQETLALLRQLETMKLLEIVEPKVPEEPEEVSKIKKKWGGTISNVTANAMLDYVEKGREEWG